jgi:hypothetical protein
MKEWFCKECGSRRRTEDNIVMKICKSCQIEMQFTCFVCGADATRKIEVYTSNVDAEKYYYWFCDKHYKQYKEGKWEQATN